MHKTPPKFYSEDDLTRIVTKELDMAIYPQFIGQEKWCVNELLKQRKFKFNTDLNGIVIRYDDWEFLSETGRIIDDTPLIFWKIRCKFHILDVSNDQILQIPIISVGVNYVGCSLFKCIDVTVKFQSGMENEIHDYIMDNFDIGEPILFKVKSFIPSQHYIEGIIDEDTFQLIDKEKEREEEEEEEE